MRMQKAPEFSSTYELITPLGAALPGSHGAHEGCPVCQMQKKKLITEEGEIFSIAVDSEDDGWDPVLG
jgi:hypothetical protein